MRKLTRRDLEDLGWQRFEDLVAAIVLAEHPGAEQLGGKDGGADVLLERHDGLVRVWQAKHFAGDIRWEHCEKSLDDAVANYAPDQVVFVFPRHMSKVVRETFARRLKARHPEVDISYMGASQIFNKLRKLSKDRDEKDDLVYEFFGPDPRDQARAFADHLATHGLRLSRESEDDVLRRSFELADEAGSRDRNFRTEVALSTGEAPLAEWAEEPALVMTTAGSDRKLRIAAWPERDEEILELLFEDGKEGDRARWAVGQQLASSGVAKLPKGGTAQLTQIPKAMEAISNPTGKLRNVTLTSVQSHPVKLVGGQGQQRLERTMDLVSVPPRRAAVADARTASFGRMDGEVALFLDFVVRKDRGTVGIDLSFQLTEAPDLDRAVDALRLLVALDEGNGRLETPFLPDPIPLQLGRKSEDRIEWNRSILEFFESLVLIRDELGVDGFDFPEEVTEDENELTVLTAKVIEEGVGAYHFAHFGVEVPNEEVAELERAGYDSAIARFSMVIELLGQELYLGLAEAELPEPSEVRVLDAKQPGKRRVELKWGDEPRVLFRLIDEREPAAESGLWARGRAPEV